MIGSLASVFSSNGVISFRPSTPAAPKIAENTRQAVPLFAEESALVEFSEQALLRSSEETGTGARDGRDSEESFGAGGRELTDEEQKQVEELEKRDREVRQHEQAHIAAAGGYARGGPTFEYQKGPDGKRYAVGGEVSIDTSPEKEPEQTIRKAQTIRRAANAPAEPSPQDRAVAAEASKMEAEARKELAEVKSREMGGASPKIHGYDPTGRGQSLHEVGAGLHLVA